MGRLAEMEIVFANHKGRPASPRPLMETLRESRNQKGGTPHEDLYFG
jgi:hypothetical protein